jgi:hypothetical protein
MRLKGQPTPPCQRICPVCGPSPCATPTAAHLRMNPHGVHRGPAMVSAAHLDEEMQAAGWHGGGAEVLLKLTDNGFQRLAASLSSAGEWRVIEVRHRDG